MVASAVFDRAPAGPPGRRFAACRRAAGWRHAAGSPGRRLPVALEPDRHGHHGSPADSAEGEHRIRRRQARLEAQVGRGGGHWGSPGIKRLRAGDEAREEPTDDTDSR